jgi:hypothetical protein
MKETENIKDPNQLDLFAGIVLTVEQQKQVDHYIDSANKIIIIKETEYNKLNNYLLKQASKEELILKIHSNHH